MMLGMIMILALCFINTALSCVILMQITNGLIATIEFKKQQEKAE